MEKQLHNLTAPKLRAILIATVLVLLAGGGGAFWFIRSQLVQYASEVKAASIDASISSADISRLQNMERVLEEEAVAVNRAKKVVADSQSYQYQNQIISDITAYAKNAGVTITGFTFNSAEESSGTAAATADANAPVAPTAPAGLKSTSVSISIDSPVAYTAIMRFIHSIELNLTKMQLTGISLSAIPEDGKNVTANPLTVEVYTR